ncbi:hypothetical protein [Streptomyces melanogenes]|uniref:hypothetical protein n=1 Tax=Streptomyces melanogenes TaxID=67326 RepID=UPI0037AA630D
MRRAGRRNFALLKDWLTERHCRWPLTTNPYLLIARRNAVEDTHPRACSEAL